MAVKLGRTKKPMSAAQKAALRKAIEASARKRRGTGKPDALPAPRRVSEKVSVPSPQRKASASSASGGDHASMSLGALKKRRQELNAKRKDGSASKDEAAELVKVQAELSQRGKNMREGRGGGPSKVALGEKKREVQKKSLSDMDMVDLGNMAKDPNTLPAVKDMIAKELSARAKNTNAAGGNISQRKPTADQEWAAKKYGGKPEEYWYDKKTWNLVNGNPSTRDPKTTVTSLPKAQDMNDSDVIKDMPPEHRQKLFNARDNLKNIASKWIQRDNVTKELNGAKTVGDMIDAAQSVEWYLHEYDAASKTQPIAEFNKIFEELKKYSSRYRKGGK